MIHLLLLAVVIAMVYFASRSVYEQARQQALEQGEGSQELLAKQTAEGIKAFYDSIRDDLDLIHRADEEEAATAGTPATSPTAETPTSGPATKPTGPRIALGPFSFSLKNVAEVNAVGRGDNRMGKTIELLLWWQLETRASLLFAVDADRLELKESAQVKNPAVRVIGPVGAHRAAREVAQKLHVWLSKVTGPSVSDFQQFGDLGEGNVVCVPAPDRPGEKGRRLLVAFVPIHKVGLKFLDKLNPADNSTSATLTDAAMKTMVSSDPALVGINALQAEDPDVRGLAQSALTSDGPETIAIERPYKLGSSVRNPRMMTITPVRVLGHRWFLMVSSKLSQVDSVVNRLFRKALYWAIFVVVAMTGILVSTSISLIRGRSRLERARHLVLKREVDQAREIQKAWLPSQAVTLPRVDIAAVNRPANHISGDFYNWFELPDGRLVVTIGDVTGHGMSAAFLMATTQLLVRSTMMRVGDPGLCMTEVNRQLCTQIFVGQFVTMLIVTLDLDRRLMQVATAGHYPPLIGSGSGFKSLRVAPQLVLGVDASAEYPTQEFPIPAHASMLLYTDGVLDVEDPRGARFGKQRLAASTAGTFESAKSLADGLLREVDRFRGHKDLPDDLTFVAVQVAGGTAGEAQTPKQELTAVRTH